MIRDTSLSAYEQHRDSGELSAQEHKVMLWFHCHPGEHTRNEIAEATGLRLSSICGRVNRLIELGYLEDQPRRRCRVTGRRSHAVRLAAVQRELAL